MKTKAYIIMLVASMTAAFSCTRIEMEFTNETSAAVENGSQILVPFTAEAGESQTKVAMDGSTTNIVFSEGDQLMVYCWKIVEPSILTLKSGAGNKSAVFSGDLVLAAGKTEADLAGKTLQASLIPQEGVSQGVFSYDPSGKRLTVDYSTKCIDSDLDALFSRTAIYQGTSAIHSYSLAGRECSTGNFCSNRGSKALGFIRNPAPWNTVCFNSGSGFVKLLVNTTIDVGLVSLCA